MTNLTAIDAIPTIRQPLKISLESVVWALVLLVAALARLPALGALALRLNDTSRAWSAWEVALGHRPAAWNGDLDQTLTAGLFRLMPASDASARTIAAVSGVVLVALFIAMRPLVGRVPALLAALFVALSPICVTVSRSVSAYAMGAVIALAAAAALLQFLRRPRPAPLAWLSAVLGLGMASDATFLLFAGVAALYLVVEACWFEDEAVLAAWRYLHGRGPLVRSLLLLTSAGLLLSLTRFGIAIDRLRSGAFASWTNAFNSDGRLAPWHFTIDTLLGYELPLVILGGAGAVLIVVRHGRAASEHWQRLAVYWLVAGVLFAMIVPNRDAGQLASIAVPLALLAGGACAGWLSTAVNDDLRPAIAPTLLAAPALTYVLFVIQGATVQGGLIGGQAFSIATLTLGAVMLLALGVYWSQRAGPAFLATLGLVLGLAFALHSVSRVGFRSGDEFALGSTATAQVSPFSREVLVVAPTLKGAVSVAPALTEPLAWYLREGGTVRVQAPNRSTGAVIQPSGSVDLQGFEPLIASNEIATRWYPSTLDLSGIVRWFLYRQSWGRAQPTPVEFLVGP